ncbi:MAG: hypothetical protein AAGB18_00110 [Pseudomonadota bacterium]
MRFDKINDGGGTVAVARSSAANAHAKAWADGYTAACKVDVGNLSRIAELTAFGRHHPEGPWRIHGARLAIWHRLSGQAPQCPDASFLDGLWRTGVGARAHGAAGSGARQLNAEINALGRRINAINGGTIAEISAEISRVCDEADLVSAPPRDGETTPDALCLSDVPQIRLGVAHGVRSESVCPAERLAEFAERQTADWLLIVPGGLDLLPDALALGIDRRLLAAGRTIGMLVQAHATMVAVHSGPRLCSRDAILRHGGVPPADLTAPQVAATWQSQSSPWDAFRLGFASASTVLGDGRSAALASRLALTVSLGSEVLNGPWWRLGALWGCLGRSSLKAAWAREEPHLGDPSGMSARANTLARLVRQHHGVPAEAVDRGASRAIKLGLSGKVPRETLERDKAALDGSESPKDLKRGER